MPIGLVTGEFPRQATAAKIGCESDRRRRQVTACAPALLHQSVRALRDSGSERGRYVRVRSARKQTRIAGCNGERPVGYAVGRRVIKLRFVDGE